MNHALDFFKFRNTLVLLDTQGLLEKGNTFNYRQVSYEYISKFLLQVTYRVAAPFCSSRRPASQCADLSHRPCEGASSLSTFHEEH